jgi:hypothetical protein
MTIFYCLRFETPPTWRARSPHSYPPGSGWLGYTSKHSVSFSSPPTSHRAEVEVCEPASTRELNPSLNGSLYSRACIHGKRIWLPISIENICCLSVSMEIFCWFCWHGKRVPYQVDLPESTSPRNVLASRCLALDYSLSIRCSTNVCFVSLWLAIDFRSGSTISAFRRHVILCLEYKWNLWWNPRRKYSIAFLCEVRQNNSIPDKKPEDQLQVNSSQVLVSVPTAAKNIFNKKETYVSVSLQ